MFLSNSNLQHIINESDTGTKLSIYIPTHPASTSPTLSEDTTRFKNALQIIKGDERYTERELGETIKKLELLYDDRDFWKHRTSGLAVFADTDGYQTVDHNYEVTSMQYVQDTYVISPLAIMLSIGTGYYVLDINHTKPRLVYFTSNTQKEIVLKDMPGSFDDTVGRDDPQQHIQHQSSPRNMLHGQTESEALDADTLRYYKLIAKAVDEHLIDHDEPLLLTGTENRIGHMRPLLSYQNVMKEAVEGNNEDLNEQELQNATDELIKSDDIAKRDGIVAKVKNMPPSSLVVGQKAIEAAVTDGRVESLFLSAFRRTTDNVRDTYQVSVILQLPEDVLSTEKLIRGVLSQGGKLVAVSQGSFDNDEPRASCRF